MRESTDCLGYKTTAAAADEIKVGNSHSSWSTYENVFIPTEPTVSNILGRIDLVGDMHITLVLCKSTS